MLFRILIFAVVIGMIYVGVRRIAGDWRDKFRDMDKREHERDLRERKRPDVIDLKPGEDGVYRPGNSNREDRGPR